MIDLTPYLWSQILAFIGTILYIIGPQFKKRSKIMIINVLSSILYALHYMLLESYTGAAMDGIGALRYGVSLLTLNPLLIYVFLGLNTVAVIFTFQGWLLSGAAFLAGSFAAIGTFKSKDSSMRIFLIFSSVFWLIHGIILGSIVAALTSAFFIVSGIIGYFRHEIKAKK